MPQYNKGTHGRATANVIFSGGKLKAFSEIRNKTWVASLTTLIQLSVGSLESHRPRFESYLCHLLAKYTWIYILPAFDFKSVMQR